MAVCANRTIIDSALGLSAFAMPGFDSRHYPHCTQTDSAEAVGRWELYVGCDRGGYANNCVYEGVRGWYAFEPALTKAEDEVCRCNLAVCCRDSRTVV